jgi:hypothetical protein
MTIVHYEHRYKRPPRKKPKKPAIEVPAVVTRRKLAPKKGEAPPPAKSAIVTIRKPGKGYVPDLTPEEHQRRGDAAEAIFREMKRKIAARGRHVPRGFV